MMPRPAALALLAIAAVTAVAAAGCTQETVTVDVRSLERSGRSAFVCLGAPDDPRGTWRALTDCSRAFASSTEDYGVDESGQSTLPHLYALVTQTTRGEVAVIDMTTEEFPVLDQDPSVPGATFLPIGAQPIDIAASPGGTATFVTVAEIGREGIFALPSTMIRPSSKRPPATLSSWPACSLPSAPGDILIVTDPAKDGLVRDSCDAPHDMPASGEEGGEGSEANASSAEEEGRLKLLVTMPEQGGLVVVDAQALLERQPGSYDPCPVERWVPLRADLPPPATPTPAEGPACASPEIPTPSAQPVGTPRPGGMTISGGRLYIADLEAPVVHVVDLPTPCEPVEQAPLLPTSLEEPERVVTTTRVAASRSSTPEFRRYLYAVDAEDGSLMVFDIGDGAAQRTPLTRQHPEWNPFYPADRIRFAAPVRDLTILERDVPVVDPETGVAESGLRCDPNPTLDVCANQSDPDCDRATLYRTASTYETGAGPRRLRGTFAFALLTNGRIGVIDIDDLDAACRTPNYFSEIQGCSAVGPSGFGPPVGAPPDDIDADGVKNDVDNCPYHPNPDQANREKDDSTPTNDDEIGNRCDRAGSDGGLETSDESSCNVVIPNAPRSANYLTTRAGGRDEPGLQILPILYDRAGTALNISEELPLMRAVLGVDPGPDPAGLALVVAGEAIGITGVDEEAGLIVAQDGPRHTLAMNLEDPRAHVVDQAWAVTYEAALPGFEGNYGLLQCVEACADGDATQKRWDLLDSAGLFCGHGVQSEAGVREQLLAEGATQDQASAQAAGLADYVEIVSEIPSEIDAYWTLDAPAKPAACTYDVCNRVFNASTGTARELTILEAYEDRLVLDSPALGAGAEAQAADLNCCFPSRVQFRVRARGQWVVTSQSTGFLHHVIADPATGVCRNSCDPSLARMNGRVRPAPRNQPVFVGDPVAFQNPMFRFAISAGTAAPQRDMQFRFVTQGSFEALFINLAASTADLQPQSLRVIPATGDLAITDGSLEGLLLVNPATLDLSRQFY